MFIAKCTAMAQAGGLRANPVRVSAALAGWLFLSALVCRGEERYVREQYDRCRRQLMDEFLPLIATLARSNAAPGPVEAFPAVAETDLPWWMADVGKPTSSGAEPRPLTLEDLHGAALAYSKQIASFSDIPLIRKAAVTEAKGDFAPQLYVKTQMEKVDEPVGDILTTGGSSNLVQDSKMVEAGIRKRFPLGTSVALAETLNWVENNSIYFSPASQALAQVSLNLTQPLLLGAGKRFNLSQVTLAEIDTSVGMAELQRQAEAHLLELTRTYWLLYLERVNLRTKSWLIEKAESTLREMEERRDMDALSSQLKRVQSALAMRSANAVRCQVGIRNAQSRLRSLVNEPQIEAGGTDVEFLPATPPQRGLVTPDLREAMIEALRSRPEIEQALRQWQAAELRVEVAKHQMRPVLNLIGEIRSDGLTGDYHTGESFEAQGDGNLSGVVGLTFETPWPRTEPESRRIRRTLEARQLLEKMRATAHTVLLEVEIAVREVDVSYREMLAYYKARNASLAELRDVEGRRGLAADRARGSDALEDVLNAQYRLAQAEEMFAQSLVTYNLALVSVKKARGTLLRDSHIRLVEKEKDGLPLVTFERGD